MAIQPAVRNNEYFRALECAITQEYMNDPVIDPCGHTYEKEKIKEWLQEHETCPLSGKHVNARSLIPNLMVHDITNELQGGLELRITAVIQQEIDHIKGGIRSEYRLYIKELREECNGLKEKLAVSLYQEDILQKRLEQSNKENQQKNKEIQENHDVIQKQGNQIKEKEGKVQEKENIIEKKESMIEEKENIIRVQQSQIQDNETEKRLYQVALAIGTAVLIFFNIKS